MTSNHPPKESSSVVTSPNIIMPTTHHHHHPPKNTLSELLEWNLIDHISPYLDRHMIFPLLDYFEKQIQEMIVDTTNPNDETKNGDTTTTQSLSLLLQDVNEARYQLLRPTHMIDYMMDVYNQSISNNNNNNKKSNDDDNNNNKEELLNEMIQQKQNVLQELESLKQQCLPLLEGIDITTRESLQASGQWNVPYLLETYPNSITLEVIDAYRNYGRFQFDCGDYECARTILCHYIHLYASPPITTTTTSTTVTYTTPNATNATVTTTTTTTLGGTTNEDNEDEELAGITVTTQPPPKKDGTSTTTTTTPVVVGNPSMFYLQSCDSAMLHVLWGRLACEILVLDWTNAIKALEAVKTALESMVTTTSSSSNQLTALQALQQRTWLLHWSLFVYWNAPAGGLEQLVELFLSERYKQAITTVAPHLLRYLTAAVLLCKRRGEKAVPTAEARKLVKQLIYVMQDCDYTDPIVEFVNCLCIKFDFDSAQEKLAACEKVLSADFFLCHQTALFMEEARVFVFENYCRIHNKIDLVALGDKLAMDQVRAERWIVDLIRNAELDAKIDSTAGCVVMGLSQPPTIHELIVDRTRDCNLRTATMTQNFTNMILEARKEKVKRELLAREQD